MATYPDLLDNAFTETLACQDPSTAQSKGRHEGRYGPLGPYIPGEGGSYPTTDAAFNAIAELADGIRDNDSALLRATSRDTVRSEASRVIGELLPQLLMEGDRRRRWVMVRDRLKTRLLHLRQDLMHYVPVWLFLDQVCPSFSIGPVRFVQRENWLGVIEARRGRESDWMPEVRKIWSGHVRTRLQLWSGAKAAARELWRSPRRPISWLRAFRAGSVLATPQQTSARTVARAVHPDQWVACVEAIGFERDESRRRGVLAIRVALDTLRLVIPGPHRALLSTAADTVQPLSIDRFSQAANEDLAHGWRFNRLGVGGAPGLAQAVIIQSQAVFEAAGACIAAATNVTPSGHGCPTLADRWFNAVHWFGRACLSDGDFVAVVMLVVALDILSGGLQDDGIVELVARLTGASVSAPVLPDGTDLRKLVERSYKLRSEVAHGSILAVHETLDIERAQLESLAAAALAEYVLRIHVYAQAGGSDDRDDFRRSLPMMTP
jgi:Apea-like HEPN